MQAALSLGSYDPTGSMVLEVSVADRDALRSICWFSTVES